MAYGLLISTVATSEVAAMQVGLGTFFPTLMLSGNPPHPPDLLRCFRRIILLVPFVSV
jgi:hypothetical protein